MDFSTVFSHEWNPGLQDTFSFAQNISHPFILAVDSGVPVLCGAPSLPVMCLVWPRGPRGPRGREPEQRWALGNVTSAQGPSSLPVSVLLLVFSMLHRCSNAFRSIFLPTSPASGKLCEFEHFFFFLFFLNAEKKSLHSHNKNKSVLYFTIYFKYFHYEAFMSPTGSRRITTFSKDQRRQGFA